MPISRFKAGVVLAFLSLGACQAPPQQEVSSASAMAVSQSASAPAEPVRPAPTDAEIAAPAAAFMAAVTSNDPAALRGYFAWEPEAVDVTFAHDTLRPIIRGQKMSAKTLWRDGEVISVVFYQNRFATRIDTDAYRQSDYLKTFFVCNFNDSGVHWIVAHPVLCYDETEGPFERVGY